MSIGLIRVVVVTPPRTAEVHWTPNSGNHDGKMP